MSTIVLPRFLSIDTSALGKMAADFWSGDEFRRRRATETVKRLVADNWVIVLMLEHIQELLQHGDSSVAHDRILFLRQLPLVATLKTFSDSQVGSVCDIDCHEINAIINRNMRTHSEVISFVRERCWNFFTGEELVGDIDGSWEAIRDRTSPLLGHSIEIASILRSGDQDVWKIKLKDICRKQLPASSQSIDVLSKLASNMASRLKRHGDKRLHECDSVATQFHRELWADLRDMSQDGKDLLSSVIRYYGVDASYVTPEMTVAELGDLAVFVRILAKAAERLRVSGSLSLSDVSPDACPAWTLRRRLREHQNAADRVDGSDLIDAHVAAITLYADAVHVDKRTADHFRKIQSRHDCAYAPTRHFRESNYWEIPTAVASLFDRNAA